MLKKRGREGRLALAVMMVSCGWLLIVEGQTAVRAQGGTLVERPAPGSPVSPGWQYDQDAGWAAFKAGRLAAAEALLRQSAEQARQTMSPGDARAAQAYDHLAWVRRLR